MIHLAATWIFSRKQREEGKQNREWRDNDEKKRGRRREIEKIESGIGDGEGGDGHCVSSRFNY